MSSKSNDKSVQVSKNKKEVKSRIIRLRVTENEANKFKIKAKEKGFSTVSAYIRSIINEDDIVNK